MAILPAAVPRPPVSTPASRVIALVHYKLAGTVHAAIQGAHALGRLQAQYPEGPASHALLWDWLRQHETLIIKNGGSSRMLTEAMLFLDQLPMDLMVADFRESEEDMEGLRTAIALVVPDAIAVPGDTDPEGIGLKVATAQAARRAHQQPAGWSDLAADPTLPAPVRLHAFLRQFNLA